MAPPLRRCLSLRRMLSRKRERVEVCKQYGDALIAYSHECAFGKQPPFPKPPSVSDSGDSKALPETVVRPPESDCLFLESNRHRPLGRHGSVFDYGGKCRI